MNPMKISEESLYLEIADLGKIHMGFTKPKLSAVKL